MIYTTRGVMQRQYTQINGDDWKHLLDTVNRPPQLNNLTSNQLEAYKRMNAPYVVYGQSTGLERGTSEIVSRSIMFIDIDDSGKDYPTMANYIANFLGTFDTNLVIYPTINNTIKSGERLRVGIPLDVELTPNEYGQVWQVLTHSMHLQADSAGAQKAFKQLQGLYVKTTQNAHNEPIIANDGTALNTAFFLSKYENLPKPDVALAKKITKPDNSVAKTGNAPKWAITNRQIINALLDPENHYSDFGGWDNMLTSIGGWVFKNTQGDIELSATAVQETNDKGSDPIPFNDLKQKFKSWMTHWHY
ncbi:hypothetical protein [Weissella viridescens]|uniref:hypothetical protein n=1 Tax=Weissella viridescens TaxID=1629 RepID=UPI003AF27AB4